MRQGMWGEIKARRSVDGLVAFPPEAEEKYEDVYSLHRQKTQKNTTQYTRKRLQYDETIQYNILQYSRVCIIKKQLQYIYFVIPILGLL